MYTVQETKTKTSDIEKKLMVFRPKDNAVLTYTDTGYKEIDYDVLKSMREKPWLYDYILVKGDRNKTVDLKTTYDLIIHDNPILKNLSNGLINMFKSGGTTNTALGLFKRLQHCLEPEQMATDEAEFIENAYDGPMVFATNDYKGDAYKYDVCSMYPYLMQLSNFLIPMKRGEIKTISNTEIKQIKFFATGIYRCILINNDFRLVRNSKRDHYTHTDLNRATKLGYTIEMIEDGRPNALVYTRDKCVTGYQLFKPYIDLLFPIKQSKKTKLAKDILNQLWGVLCKKNKLHAVGSNKIPFELHEDSRIVTMCPSDENDGNIIIGFMKIEKPFDTDYARLGPFLLSAGRNMLSKIIEPVLNTVVRVQTDGVILSSPLPNHKHSEELGGLKYEGRCENVWIEHVNGVRGEFNFI